jgi:hypothetical protein
VIATNRTQSEEVNATKLSSGSLPEEAEADPNSVNASLANSTSVASLPLCPEFPPKLVGRLKVLLEVKEWAQIEVEHGVRQAVMRNTLNQSSYESWLWHNSQIFK